MNLGLVAPFGFGPPFHQRLKLCLHRTPPMLNIAAGDGLHNEATAARPNALPEKCLAATISERIAPIGRGVNP